MVEEVRKKLHLKRGRSSQPQCVVLRQAGRSATVQQHEVDGVDILLRLDSIRRGVCDRSTLFTLSKETKAFQTRGWQRSIQRSEVDLE